MHKIPFLWQYAELASHRVLNDKCSGNEIFKDATYIPMVHELDEGYVAIYKDKVIVAFKGTKNIKAWLSNVDTYPLDGDSKLSILGQLKHGPWGKGTIHDGFYEGWMQFKDEIDKIVVPEAKVGKAVFVTGHSRGGSMATLCARHLAKNRGIKSTCITFGAPTVGTVEYAFEANNILKLNLTNVIHGYEFTQYVPPDELGFAYAGKMVMLPEPGWHKLFCKIRDHFPSTTTKALIKYTKDVLKDEDGVNALKVVLKRAKP